MEDLEDVKSLKKYLRRLTGLRLRECKLLSGGVDMGFL